MVATIAAASLLQSDYRRLDGHDQSARTILRRAPTTTSHRRRRLLRMCSASPLQGISDSTTLNFTTASAVINGTSSANTLNGTDSDDTINGQAATTR